MAQKTLNVELVDVDKIRPSPFQPRESFAKEDIRELAKTIEKVGLLQPVSVRKKGNSFQIISGERRWRAAQFAKISRIPVIVKEATDEEMMLESLIENVQRKDLDPMEKAKGLAEVYRLAGVTPAKARSAMKSVDDALNYPSRRRALTNEEKRIKETADMVGLSYDQQWRILEQLELPEEERMMVKKLGLSIDKTASIATVEKSEDRKKLIAMAPERKREEIQRLVKVARRASEPIVKAALRPKARVTGVVAEKLMELPEEKQESAIKQIESLRLEEPEALEHIESMKVQVPLAPKEEIASVRVRMEELKKEIEAKLNTPEAKSKGVAFKNWTAHIAVMGLLHSLECPVDGSKKLGWLCHDLPIETALKQAEAKYKASIKPA
jgi:ParB/RepB/Spo0J family partition protein